MLVGEDLVGKYLVGFVGKDTVGEDLVGKDLVGFVGKDSVGKDLVGEDIEDSVGGDLVNVGGHIVLRVRVAGVVLEERVFKETFRRSAPCSLIHHAPGLAT